MADTLHEGRCSFMLLASVMERETVFFEEKVQVAGTLENKKKLQLRETIFFEVRTEAAKFSWRANMSLDTFEYQLVTKLRRKLIWTNNIVHRQGYGLRTLANFFHNVRTSFKHFPEFAIIIYRNSLVA